MTSRTTVPFTTRASNTTNPLTRTLLTIAAAKHTNLVVSLDVTTSSALLSLADTLGPHIAVLKTHVDIVDDLTASTLSSLRRLARRHSFLLFEDRKFVDIGSTVQKQYRGGVSRIVEWAHIVNCAVLAGPGIVDALEQVGRAYAVESPRSDEDEEEDEEEEADKGKGKDHHHHPERGLLILAEMTSQGSLATGPYTEASVNMARKHRDFVIGFVATRELSQVAVAAAATAAGAGGGETETETETPDEDFIIFTTGVNLESKGDSLGQRYQTPKSAVERGADFIIAGRGIYAAPDPAGACRRYREEGWKAYLERVGGEGSV